MSYTILKTDGTPLTNIPDNVVNTDSTSLSLPGRNFASYGQILDTNFVHQLENFADTTVPANPIRGQLWYKTDTEILYVCPSDGETNPANWYPILTPQSISNLTLDNLTANANITANNASITNDLDANVITTNYLTVNVNANIAEANISGVAYVNEVNTRSITTGTTPTLGNIIGAWTVNGRGTINSVANTSLWVTGGNLVITDAVNPVGIKTDNYYYANGVALDFSGTYSDSNVASFLPTYIGNVGAQGSLTIFNGRTLSTGDSSTPGTIIGDWTLSSGSKINGLANINGANVTGTVANAQNAQFAVNADVANTVAVNAQPNITSVGTLTGLVVSGNSEFTGQEVNLGAVGNVRIFGGAAGQVLSTNGSGVLSWSAAAAATTAITVTGNDQPNITSVGTLTSLVVSANITAGGRFIGSGQGLTNIPGGNVVGSVPNAVNATSAASANSVAWTNVSGRPTNVSAFNNDAGYVNIPAGTRMLFQQTSAPTGWTKDTNSALNDAALRVVTGSAGSGGSAGFTSAFRVQSVTGSINSTTAGGSISSTTATGDISSTTAEGSISSTETGGTVGDTTLTAAQMPNHTHFTVGDVVVNGGKVNANGPIAWSNGNDPGEEEYELAPAGSSITATLGRTSSAGSGQPHTHTFTGSSHTHTFTGTSHNHIFTGTSHSHAFNGTIHTHNFTGTSINLAVKYVDIIIATRN